MGKSQEPQELSKEFARISQESILRQWEEKNRERIASASFNDRMEFDALWMKVIGKSYYAPITTTPIGPAIGQNNTERSDPKGCNYRENLTFSSVKWNKLPRRKIGRKFRDLYNIKGVEQDTGKVRPIFQNLTVARLSQILTTEAKDKIVEASKKMDHGEVSGPFPIDVEGYWEVSFSPQQHDNDLKDVRLMWEGICLIIQRMTPVVLPGFYIEVADNALRDRYTHTAKLGRKKVGTVQTFPYTTLRRATREEYLVQKAAGDKLQREAMLREENA